MKIPNLLLILSLFLLLFISLQNCNCSNWQGKAKEDKLIKVDIKKIAKEEELLINSIQNSELKEYMLGLAKNTTHLTLIPFAMLEALKEGNEDKQIEVIKFLAAREKIISPICYYRCLQEALESQRNKVALFLLSLPGMDVNYRDDHSITLSSNFFLVHEAVTKASAEVVKALVDKGADFNLKAPIGSGSLEGNTLLYGLLSSPFDTELVTRNFSTNEEIRTSITNSIKTREEILDILLNCNKVDKNAINKDGKSSKESIPDIRIEHMVNNPVNKLREISDFLDYAHSKL